MSSKIGAEWPIERRLSTRSDILGRGRIENRLTGDRCDVRSAGRLLAAKGCQRCSLGMQDVKIVDFTVQKQWFLREGQIEIRSAGARREVGWRLHWVAQRLMHT